MVEEYQSKATQFQQKSATWTAAIKDAKQKELVDIETRIQEFQQTISQELQQKQAELMNPIMEKAQKAVQDAVFDSGSALYFDEAAVVDLTPAARKSLGIKEGRTLEQLQQELQAQAQAQNAQ